MRVDGIVHVQLKDLVDVEIECGACVRHDGGGVTDWYWFGRFDVHRKILSFLADTYVACLS